MKFIGSGSRPFDHNGIKYDISVYRSPDNFTDYRASITKEKNGVKVPATKTMQEIKPDLPIDAVFDLFIERAKAELDRG
jgi:hypothetical protein